MKEAWDSYTARVATEAPPTTEFSRERWKTLSETGLFFVEAPFDHQLRTLTHRFRELGLASHDRGLTFSAVTQVASSIYCLQAFGDEEIQRQYLPKLMSGDIIGGHAITEDNAGSDVANMDTTAACDGSEYILNGAKKYITNAPIADVLVVYAKTLRDGRDVGISPFLVPCDHEGVKRSPPMGTAGLKSSPIGEIEFHDVRISESHRIGFEGGGMMILDQVMKREIVLAFSANLGEIEQRRNLAIKHSNQRIQFGSTIGANQLVSNKIVNMQISLELGGALIDKITQDIMGTKDVSISTIVAKLFISEQNLASAVDAIHIFGAHGYLAETGLTDMLLDAVPGTIYSGANGTLRSKLALMLGVRAS